MRSYRLYDWSRLILSVRGDRFRPGAADGKSELPQPWNVKSLWRERSIFFVPRGSARDDRLSLKEDRDTALKNDTSLLEFVYARKGFTC